MNKEELFKIAEIVEHEKKFCKNDCCRNHLTIINGYLLKKYLEETNSAPNSPKKSDSIGLKQSLNSVNTSEANPCTDTIHKNCEQKGCGAKMDAIGYIHCGDYDDLKHGGKQWLCDKCKLNEKEIK